LPRTAASTSWDAARWRRSAILVDRAFRGPGRWRISSALYSSTFGEGF
jgi:hypothetical protein